MKRFIDLTTQYWTDPEEKQLVFAFLDTTTDTFDVFDATQVWTSVKEFEDRFWAEELKSNGANINVIKIDIKRYLRLIPEEHKNETRKHPLH